MGKPENISKLQIEDLIRFHKECYVPANCFFSLYGNIPLEKTLQFIDEEYLSGSFKNNKPISIQPQSYWPTSQFQRYFLPGVFNNNGSTSIQLGWLLGKNSESREAVADTIIAEYLTGTSFSLLNNNPKLNSLGNGLSEINGILKNMIQNVFVFGITDVKSAALENTKKIIYEILSEDLENGLDISLLKATINRIESSIKSAKPSDRHPVYLAERCLRSWTYNGDPYAYLEIERSLNELKMMIESDYFKKRIEKQLIENNHHIISIIQSTKEKRLSVNTINDITPRDEKSAASKKKNTSETIIGVNDGIKKSNKPIQDSAFKAETIISKPTDIPTDIFYMDSGKIPVYCHNVDIAGITNIGFLFDFNEIPYDLIQYLPLFSRVFTFLATKKYAQNEIIRKMALYGGEIKTNILVEETIGNDTLPLMKFLIFCKLQDTHLNETFSLLHELFLTPVFNNPELIMQSLYEFYNQIKSSIINNNTSYIPILCSSAGFYLSHFYKELLKGISQFKFLKKLVSEKKPEIIIEAFQKIFNLLIKKNNFTISIIDKEAHRYVKICENLSNKMGESQTSINSKLPFPNLIKNTGITIMSPVNTIVKAWDNKKKDPISIGRLQLLSVCLSKKLWRTIHSNNGAYAVFTSIMENFPSFYSVSLCDPHLTKTLKCFDSSLESFVKGNDLDNFEVIRSFILSKFEKAHPIASEIVFSETISQLMGKTAEYRKQIKEAIKNTTKEILQKTAEDIYANCQSSVVVCGNEQSLRNGLNSGIKLIIEKIN